MASLEIQGEYKLTDAGEYPRTNREFAVALEGCIGLLEATMNNLITKVVGAGMLVGTIGVLIMYPVVLIGVVVLFGILCSIPQARIQLSKSRKVCSSRSGVL